MNRNKGCLNGAPRRIAPINMQKVFIKLSSAASSKRAAVIVDSRNRIFVDAGMIFQRGESLKFSVADNRKIIPRVRRSRCVPASSLDPRGSIAAMKAPSSSMTSRILSAGPPKRPIPRTARRNSRASRGLSEEEILYSSERREKKSLPRI